MESLIDVIVPVYKVENYLKRCVDSLLNQTFNDYMIILVDDGSPDKCPQICDQYKLKYPEKIVVVHKKNGGLSDARNEGVKVSKSPLIVFVDSDDYVTKTFLAKLYECYCDSSADIIISQYKKEFVNSKNEVLKTISFKTNPFTLDHDSALIELCYECSFRGYAWGKLYKREIVEKYPYPINRLFEDVFTIYKQFDDSKLVCCTGETDYIYTQRSDSIMNHSYDDRHFDLMIAANEMRQYLKNKKIKHIIQASQYRVWKSAHITLRHAVDSKDFRSVYKKIKPYLKDSISIVIGDKKVRPLEKIIFFIMNYFGELYYCVFKFKRFIQRKEKVYD